MVTTGRLVLTGLREWADLNSIIGWHRDGGCNEDLGIAFLVLLFRLPCLSSDDFHNDLAYVYNKYAASVSIMALIGSRAMVFIRVSIPSLGISPVYIFSFSPSPPCRSRRIYWRSIFDNQHHLYFGDLLESIN